MGCFNIGNYHEPNVDWLIIQLQEALKNWDATEKSWEETKQWITDYFANLNVEAEIDAKLQQMLDDGTLEEIINQKIFGELNEKVSTNTQDISTLKTTTEQHTTQISNLQETVSKHATEISNIKSELSHGYVIIMGDSYAVGESSGGQNTSWAYKLGTDLVAQGLYDGYVLLAKNGAAFNITGDNKFQTMLESYISNPTYPLANCKAIIVGTALNDAWNLTGLWTQCQAFHDIVHVNFPNARLGVACIGWTYDTTKWSNFRTAYQDISNAFSRFGQFLYGPQQIMHNYALYASGDSSHPNDEGQNQIKGAVMNAFITGSFNYFIRRSILPITAPSGQSISGAIYQEVNGNNVFLSLANLKMSFNTPVAIACTNASVAKLGDMSLQSCFFISDGSDNLAIKTPAILSHDSTFSFAIASINIVAAEILLSFTDPGFTIVNNVTDIQFLDTTAMFDRMCC